MVGFVGFGLSVQKGVRRLTVGMKMEVDPAIVEYVAPEFTKGLPVSAPSWRARLAMQWTPIQKFRLPGLPEEFEVFVKRDDMTGSTLSGNKIRKLEFILADAVEKKADTIITCGGRPRFCVLNVFSEQNCFSLTEPTTSYGFFKVSNLTFVVARSWLRRNSAWIRTYSFDLPLRGKYRASEASATCFCINSMALSFTLLRSNRTWWVFSRK